VTEHKAETLKPPRLAERLSWARAVTSRDLPNLPVHRWFYFPHSFGPSLVADLLKEWRVDPGSVLLDPFAGAGTTLVAARNQGMRAVGYDLSPLAVYVSQVKTSCLEADRLRNAAASVLTRIKGSSTVSLDHYDEMIHRAFPEPTLIELNRLSVAISNHENDPPTRDALGLALLSILPRFSALVCKGGWLSKVVPAEPASEVQKQWVERVDLFAADTASNPAPAGEAPHVAVADTRSLPCPDASVDAVITSPPYPNRHDYTRVFGVELAFGFLDGQQIKALRIQSLHSHPEAKPTRPPANGYTEPRSLTDAVAAISPNVKDGRIPRLLQGYFRDLYLSLTEIHRVLKAGGRAALVVGNTQYAGVTVETDSLTAEIAHQVGLDCQSMAVARYRGNSAQQMAEHGRTPQRESVVTLAKPLA
jgi:DNA modification methylase